MSDDFSARYRLLKCVLVDDGIRTHNAQEVATGKVVMVHINDAAGPDEVDAIRAQLASLPAGHKNMVLETATLASGFAVVTEFLPGLTSFGGWLGREKGGTSAVGEDASRATGVTADPAPNPVAKPAIRVSFRKPFKAPADVPPIAGGVGVSLPVTAPQAGPASSASLAHSAPPTASASLAPSAALPDSFSAIFGAPVDPKSLDSGVEYVRSGQPAAPVNFALHSDVKLKSALPTGESGMPVPSAPVTPPPAPKPSAPAAAPGEFTMMFAPASPPAAAAPTPPPVASRAPSPTSAPASATAAASATAPTPALPPPRVPQVATPQATHAEPVVASRPRAGVPLAAATPVSELLSGPPPLEPPLPSPSSPATPVPFVAPAAPRPAAPALASAPPAAATRAPEPPPPAPAPSPFGWDTPAVVAAPVSKAPPGEFTMLFGAPEHAAPLPEQVRNSPMKEAPPPAFSTLTPEKQLESPPVEPMHRVMSGNPAYGAGINQAGQSPIGNNLAGGGYGGGAHYPPTPQPPASLNYGAAAYPSRQPYQAMPEFAPQPPAPSYPAAHASPMFSQEKQLAGEPGSAPGILPPPIFSSGSSTPLSALGGAAQRINANAGPSEYTQLIANGPAPVVPELKPAKSTTDPTKTGRRRLPTGLIVVINAVLLIATLLIFFVYKTQVPTVQNTVPAMPRVPNMPTAPKLPP